MTRVMSPNDYSGHLHRRNSCISHRGRIRLVHLRISRSGEPRMENPIQLTRPNIIDRLPMAAYAVSAPDGVLTWFNAEAARMWGREPAVGDPDERFCGCYRLYRPDGSFMAHSDTPVAEALKSGASCHGQ